MIPKGRFQNQGVITKANSLSGCGWKFFLRKFWIYELYIRILIVKRVYRYKYKYIWILYKNLSDFDLEKFQFEYIFWLRRATHDFHFLCYFLWKIFGENEIKMFKKPLTGLRCEYQPVRIYRTLKLDLFIFQETTTL